jgi:hypothetical protein
VRPEDVQPGTIITNGSSAIMPFFHLERDTYWKTSGWRGDNIALEQYGGNRGTTGFVADYLLSDWYPLPLEWTPLRQGTGQEERYVWRSGWSYLERQVRQVDT